MKKTAMILIMMLIDVSVFAQNGVIREISGTVELKPIDASVFVAAKEGDLIAQDTVVSTGFKSTALIEVGSSIIALRPLTRLTLSEISASAGTETLNVDLQAGRVRVDVNPPVGTKASMTISSPSATASVRGTSFFFDGRNVSVGTGVVNFSGNRGVPVPVPASSTSSVTTTGKAAPSTYVYTRPSGGSGSNSDSSSGDGGFMVGSMTGGYVDTGMGGQSDGLLPSGPVGSDPSSGFVPITVAQPEPDVPITITPPSTDPTPTDPVAPPITIAPPVTTPTDPPPSTLPPVTTPTDPPPTDPPPSTGNGVNIGIEYS